MLHMETALKVSADRYLAANLFGLAERSWTHMVAMYRFEAQTNSNRVNSAQQKITNIYSKILTSYKNMTEASVTFAMGSFFRVQYIGSGVPLSLRGKENIYRNGKQLHVSEFQSLIKQHLLEVVSSGTVVSVVPDSHQIPDESHSGPGTRPLTATIVMTSVKPLDSSVSNGLGLGLALTSIDQEIPFSFLRNDLSRSMIPMYAGNITERAISTTGNIGGTGSSGGVTIASSGQASRFQYSVPFTIGTSTSSGGDGSGTGSVTVSKRRSHAKTMDAQWKRTITLTVESSFPYVIDRQRVVSRDSRELSPIENAVDDILERIESMKSLHEKSSNDVSLKAVGRTQGQGGQGGQPPTLSPELNNIMRLVQGTVMPQVNAGVAEVAKVFLGAGGGTSGSSGSNGGIGSGTGSSVGVTESESLDSNSSLPPVPPDPDPNPATEIDAHELLDNTLLMQLTLIEFLLNAKKLLELTRRILIADAAGGNTNGNSNGNGNSNQREHGSEENEPNNTNSGTGSASGSGSGSASDGGSPGGPSTSMEYTYTVWQLEMEKAYDTLIEVITPYLVILDPIAIDKLYNGVIPIVKMKYNCNQVWRTVTLKR